MINILNNHLLFLRNNLFYKGYSEYELPYRPQRVRHPTIGEGIEIISYNNRSYLITHSENGNPVLIGRVKGKIWKRGDKNFIYCMNKNSIPLEEFLSTRSYLERIARECRLFNL